MARRKKNTSVRGQTGEDIHPRGTITTRTLVTEDMVEQRAREIALISGREPNRVTGSDRIQAKKELLGDKSASDAADESGIVPSGMGSPPVSRGTKTQPALPTDDQVETDTVEEGIDEAAHNSMLDASKSQTRSEG
jgi:hypothetical protein